MELRLLESAFLLKKASHIKGYTVAIVIYCDCMFRATHTHFEGDGFVGSTSREGHRRKRVRLQSQQGVVFGRSNLLSPH